MHVANKSFYPVFMSAFLFFIISGCEHDIQNIDSNSSNSNKTNTLGNLCEGVTCTQGYKCIPSTGNCEPLSNSNQSNNGQSNNQSNNINNNNTEPVNPTESLNCYGLVLCTGQCQTRMCIEECQSKSVNTESKQLEQNLRTCYLEEQCTSNECIQEKCPIPYQHCIYDMNVLINENNNTDDSMSCDESWFCIFDCQGRVQCANNCYNKASTINQQKIILLADCYKNSSCNPSNNECTAADCADEVTACKSNETLEF